jgi:hypothetical protein
MQLWNNLIVISLLGLISMAGIVAMLLLNGIWDMGYFDAFDHCFTSICCTISGIKTKKK